MRREKNMGGVRLAIIGVIGVTTPIYMVKGHEAS